MSMRTDPIFQAALTRDTAYAPFSADLAKLGPEMRGDLEHFEWNPSSSLTWKALEALEHNNIVRVVEYARGALHKPHFPEAIHKSLERLALHRNKISHPYKRTAEWSDPKMRKFDEDKGEYEPRLPLIWALRSLLNEELARRELDARPEFIVTLEMAHLLRHIWEGCLKPQYVETIPPAAELVALLRTNQEMMLKRFASLASKR